MIAPKFYLECLGNGSHKARPRNYDLKGMPGVRGLLGKMLFLMLYVWSPRKHSSPLIIAIQNTFRYDRIKTFHTKRQKLTVWASCHYNKTRCLVANTKCFMQAISRAAKICGTDYAWRLFPVLSAFASCWPVGASCGRRCWHISKPFSPSLVGRGAFWRNSLLGIKCCRSPDYISHHKLHHWECSHLWLR